MEKTNNKNIFPNYLVILVCGIPGCGKTFFSELLAKKFEKELKNYSIHNLNFDNIFIPNIIDDSLILTKFKETRNKFFNNFKEIIEKEYTNEKDCILIIDDNFYFKSMRKPYFKYCKHFSQKFSKINICYLEIFLKCEIDYAIINNEKRQNLCKIPKQVIENICLNFEWCSFWNEIIYEIKISDLNTITDFFMENCSKETTFKNLVKIIKEKCFIVKEIWEKEIILDEEKNKIKKELKALFIDELEIQLRKKIGLLFKQFKGDKLISTKKSDFMKCIKNYLSNNKNQTQLIYNKSIQIEIHDIIYQIKKNNFNIEYIPSLLKLFNIE